MLWFVTIPSIPASEYILPKLVSSMFLPTRTLLYHGLVGSSNTFSSGRMKRMSCLKASCGNLLKYKSRTYTV